MEVKRSRLFEEVWSEPLTVLAKKYKVSDVAVAKACRKHKIPLPGVGHWAKVAAGKAPPTPAAATPRRSRFNRRSSHRSIHSDSGRCR